MQITTDVFNIKLQTQAERNDLKDVLIHALNNPPGGGFSASKIALAEAVRDAIIAAPQDE